MTRPAPLSRGVALVASAVVVSLSLVAAAWIGGAAVRRVKPGRTLTVKGFAERPIASDHALWNGNLVVRADALAAGYDKLEADLGRLRSYLTEAGIPEEQVRVAPVSINVRFRTNEHGMWTGEVDGYDLNQTVTVTSSDVAAVERVSREAAGLIRQGVEINSFPPSYHYTKLDDLKIELLGEAAADARRRAEEISDRAGAGAGELVSATQGVFQITPAFSTEVESGGMYDTSSIDKTVRAVVTVSFEVE
jgi:hypothetical protein